MDSRLRGNDRVLCGNNKRIGGLKPTLQSHLLTIFDTSAHKRARGCEEKSEKIKFFLFASG
jgi:hypothetical protein